mmetsp:Transcript_30446/g.59477  ORF Transcript_30446/g.59477 Transcript_30446/m.59477 type:complete len:303 (-) Transcript_30446:438-1346(-)
MAHVRRREGPILGQRVVLDARRRRGSHRAYDHPPGRGGHAQGFVVLAAQWRANARGFFDPADALGVPEQEHVLCHLRALSQARRWRGQGLPGHLHPHGWALQPLGRGRHQASERPQRVVLFSAGAQLYAGPACRLRPQRHAQGRLLQEAGREAQPQRAQRRVLPRHEDDYGDLQPSFFRGVGGVHGQVHRLYQEGMGEDRHVAARRQRREPQGGEQPGGCNGFGGGRGGCPGCGRDKGFNAPGLQPQRPQHPARLAVLGHREIPGQPQARHAGHPQDRRRGCRAEKSPCRAGPPPPRPGGPA